MEKQKIEKLRRYLVEAAQKTYGCTSATCEMNPKNPEHCGTAHLCRCGYVVKTMVKAANQIIDKEMPDEKRTETSDD